MAERPSFSINSFRSQITKKHGLARGHMFTCRIQGLNILSDFSEKHTILCKSATLPAYTVSTEELKYFTRSVKFPGSRTYEPIRLTFLHSYNYELRRLFERWQVALNSFEHNARNVDDISAETTIENYPVYRDSFVRPDDFRLDQLVGSIILDHYQDNAVLANRYTLFGAFPTSISGLTFGYDNDGEFQTYEVEFAYQYMKPTPAQKIEDIAVTQDIWDIRATPIDIDRVLSELPTGGNGTSVPGQSRWARARNAFRRLSGL